MLPAQLHVFNKKIVLAPLDWGLGHAARCVPLIQQLQQQNNTIVVACTPNQKNFLQQELNDITYVDLIGYEVRYAKQLPLWIKILWQMPRLISIVKKEKKWLADYLRNNQTDLVISDNRFGFYNKGVESIFITHQLHIQTPVLKSLVNTINLSFIKKFNACWVPDYREAEKRISGALSVPYRDLKQVCYIGPLSRFKKNEQAVKKFDVLIVLSGPEPQRTLLEEKLASCFETTSYKVALVRGSLNKKKFPSNFHVVDIASSIQLQELFACSEKVICRSGYSTLMDLHAMDLKALLVPTPGQTEQEYLAAYWQKSFGYLFLEQKDVTQESIALYMQG